MTGALLVLNAGSSSLKFRLFDPDLALLANGRITGIGSDATFQLEGAQPQNLPSYTTQEQALHAMLHWLIEQPWTLRAITHRIVHGGSNYTAPTRLNDAILAQLETLVPLAPLHQPHALSAIRLLATLYPDLPQIGCFDTAFHANHSRVFSEYAVSKSLRTQGIRRYGFHGLSYDWIMQQLQIHHPEQAAGRVVAAHLGNGASLCAIHNGKSIDTTMGMTALDGLPMGTRCGQIDPGALLYMQRELQLDAAAIEHTLSYDSGLKGLSGISNDMRELRASAHPDAAFAIEFFTMMTAQHIARMAVAIGGMDMLVFTGGIGENDAQLRSDIQKLLAFMPAFTTLTIPANEEQLMAQQCITLLQGNLI